MGAGAPNITLTYTNSANVASRVTPATLPAGLTAAAVTSVVYSGTGAGKYGPFVPWLLAMLESGLCSLFSFLLHGHLVFST